MADVQLAQARQGGDRLDIGIGQAMPGVEAHTRLLNQRSGLSNLVQLGSDRRQSGVFALLPKVLSVGPGMDLAGVKSAGLRGFNLSRLGINERADDRSRVMEKGHDVGEPCGLPGYVQPALGRDLLTTLGHERGGLRLERGGERDHLIRGRHLQVEFDMHQLGKPANIIVVNMASILAQMHGDRIRAAELRFARGPDRVRLVGPPGLADGRHMVEIDAELDHRRKRRRTIGASQGKRNPAVEVAHGKRLGGGYTARAEGPSHETIHVTEFTKKLARLKSDLVTQGDRVTDMLLRAVECFFDLDQVKAQSVIEADSVIDKVDVEIERASIPLLAMGETNEHEIRSVLTVVKINNELERIADCAVNIAEEVANYGEMPETIPQTFRVMANSVVGMLRDATRSLSNLDKRLAEQVLGFDDTVDQFKREIILDAQQKVASGEFTAKFAFKLLTVAKSLERVADHCTNVCEQVIYLESGMVVRHMPQGWSKPARPGS